MKDTYTSMETLVASDGNTIMFRKDQVLHFFIHHIEHNHAMLTQPEKEEEFKINHLYPDLLDKIYKLPLQNHLNSLGAECIPFNRNMTPEENYAQALANGPGEHETPEQFQMKLERLYNLKNWVKKNK